MFLDDLTFWSLTLTMCALALLVEAAGLVRGFFVERQAIWKCSLILLPLAVSIWSFVVAMSAVSVNIRFPRGIHMSPMAYHAIQMAMSGAITVCQLQVGIVVAVFVLMLFLERKLHLRYAYPFLRQARRPILLWTEAIKRT
jgi:hypothetical protein